MVTTQDISIIIQARTGSSRLPGKVMKELVLGRTMLSLMLERIKRSRLATQIIVATSDTGADSAVIAEAEKSGCKAFAGSENDVLGRYLAAAKHYNSGVIVRLCADSPLHDAAVVDECIQRLLDNYRKIDFVCNLMPQTHPYGMAVEVFPFDVLERIDRLTTESAQREHVTQYIHRNPQLFVIENVSHREDLSSQRWAVDTAEDFAFATNVYSRLYNKNSNFSWLDAYSLVQSSEVFVAGNNPTQSPLSRT